MASVIFNKNNVQDANLKASAVVDAAGHCCGQVSNT